MSSPGRNSRPRADRDASIASLISLFLAAVLAVTSLSFDASAQSDMETPGRADVAPVNDEQTSDEGDIVSLDPARVLESREGQASVDGLFAGGGVVGAGETVRLGVVGRGGVPADGVSAVVMNVTAINPVGRGFVTVFP